MRSRTRSTIAPNVTCTFQNFKVGAVSCSDPLHVNQMANTDGTYCPLEVTESVDDVVTPNYLTLIREGRILMNPFKKVKTVIERQPMTLYSANIEYSYMSCSGKQTQYVSSGGRNYGEVSPTSMYGLFLAAPSLDVERIKSLAVTGSYAKANEQDVDGLVVLAEGAETIRSFTSMTKRLIKILRALRKRKWKDLGKEFTAKELADRWMEYRYVLRPTIKDMCDIVKAINHSRIDKPRRLTYRSGASDSSSAFQSGITVRDNMPVGYVTAWKKTQKIVTARSGVLAAIDAISEAAIWGLDQPFTAMWELVPFSFVVDWFFNTGKTVAAWTPRYGFQTLASWVTVKTTVIEEACTESGHKGTWNPPRIYEHAYTASNGFVRKTTETLERVPNSPLPILPVWNVRLDAAKLLDLAIMGKRFLK